MVPPHAELPRILRLSACTVDLDARVARWSDGNRSLTPTELRLLVHLVSQGGRIASTRELLREVWGYRGGVVSRTVKTTMSRLRAKLEETPSRPRHLLTVVGAGYRFEQGSIEDVPTISEQAPILEEAEPRRELPPEVELIGREAVLQSLRQRLSSGQRLVTLTGPAGVGKSALALQLAWSFDDTRDFDELAWCSLGACGSTEDLVRGVAASLGVELLTDEGSLGLDGLAEAITSRSRLLLVLDELDRCVLDGRASVARLLERCEQLCLVTTTREVLGLPEEEVEGVPPLSMEAARALFASRSESGWLEGYSEPDRLGAVVAPLEGIPLAVELAASWASFLSPDDLAARLEQQLDLLQSEQGGLRAAIASSWELLDEAQRSVLCQLAVFAGPASVDAVEAVVRNEAGAAVLPLLRGLRDRSLIQQSPPPSGGPSSPRLVLLAAVRQFAREQENEAAAEARHGAWFAWLGDPDALGALAARGGDGPLRELASARLDLEVALSRAIDRRDAGVAVGTLAGLLALGRHRGPLLAHSRRVDEVLALDLGPEQRRRLLLARAEGLAAAGESGLALASVSQAEEAAERGGGAYELASCLCLRALLELRSDVPSALATVERAVEAAEESGDPVIRARCAARLGLVRRAAGAGQEALAAFERALELSRAGRDRRTEAEVLAAMGRYELDRSRPIRALSLMQKALSASRELGDRPMEADLLDAVALLEAMHEREELAAELFGQAVLLRRSLGDRGGEGRSRAALGEAQRSWGDHEAARASLSAALRVAVQLRDARLEAEVRISLGRLFLEQGRHAEGGRMLRAGLSGAEAIGSPGLCGVLVGWLAELSFLEGRADEGRRGMEQSLLQLRGSEQRTHAHALLLRWAELEAGEGRTERAEELMAQSEAEAELSRADGPATFPSF